MTSASTTVTVLRFPAPSTGFDPAICASSQQPCGVSPTSETIQAIHEAFQTLCEENTARFDRDFARANAAAGLSTEDLTQCSASSRRFSSDIEPVTVFHSKTLAKLSLYELGKIMMRSVGCLEEMLAVTVVLCARYCLSADVKPTKHIMHRLYVACMQLALKAHCDHYYRNSHFAYLAGISASELNRQEAELLRGMDWSVQVTGHELESVANCVMADLRAFTKPVQRFSGASTDRNYLAMSSNNALSQSNIDLVSLAAMPTLAESCPMKIGAVLRNAQRPLGGQEHQLDSSPFRREGSGWSRARVLQEVHEKQLIDSPHSAAGSGSDDDA